jgi:ribosomal subunit interface protein
MSVIAGRNAISWNIVNRNISPGLTAKEKLTRKITRMAKHLVHFPPQSLHLQVVLEKLEKKHSFTVRMTLRLPSNILHAEKSHEHLLSAIDSTAAALETEVKSLKAALCSDYRWKRPASRARLVEEALLFSEPMETGTGPQTDADVVSDLLLALDEQLVAHARRELRMAELCGELPRGTLEARDVVDEVARVCLAQPAKKPKTLTWEQWFYQLIRQELDRQLRMYTEERSSRIEPPPQERARTGGEDEGCDAERPLGIITSEIEPEEDLPEHHSPDRAIVPPDAAISGQELVEILQQEIKHWPADEQQVFELYFLVGFDTGEIAMIRRQSKTRSKRPSEQSNRGCASSCELVQVRACEGYL